MSVDRGRSLAEELHNATGVPVWGTIGRTDYSPVVKGQLPKLGGWEVTIVLLLKVKQKQSM